MHEQEHGREHAGGGSKESRHIGVSRHLTSEEHEQFMARLRVRSEVSHEEMKAAIATIAAVTVGFAVCMLAIRWILPKPAPIEHVITVLDPNGVAKALLGVG